MMMMLINVKPQPCWSGHDDDDDDDDELASVGVDLYQRESNDVGH